MEHGKKESCGESGCQAYFTVEAALVLPVIIGVLVYIIYFQLFWYNRCLMDQETAMMGIRASLVEAVDQEELRNSLMSWQQGYLSDKYAGWETEHASLSIRQNKLRIRREGGLSVPHAGWNAAIVYENKRLDPASFLRWCRKIKIYMEDNE